ncbi:hypothetical protein D920_00033 [Enterococcus faecalis 13-SD-W-01]|nr:hypothetical protein D920_00033 [Enterococcus faecalis 13-SD-W-01]
MIIPNENGLLYDAGNVEKFIEGILYLMDSEERRRQYSKAAYFRVADSFSIDHIFDVWDATYEKLIKL